MNSYNWVAVKKISNIGDDIKEFKIELTVLEYRNYIKRYGNGIVHKKQINFAENLSNIMYYEENNKKINVIPARCGMGKSVFIKSFLNNLVNDGLYFGTPRRKEILEPYGALVITDSLERLEEIARYEGLEDRCYLMKYNKEEIESRNRLDFKEQLVQQFKYPIVLITTQKYFKMDANTRSSLYKWANGSREIAIIDEKPILFNSKVIDETFLSNIRIAIDNCYEGEDKRYLIDKFKKINDDIDDIRKNYSEKYEVMWLKKSRETLLRDEEEDKEFFDILANNASSHIYENVSELKRIYSEGCLFVNKKNKEQENTRQFILIESNEDKFDTEKCKYYIFDATAKLDVDYSVDSNKFNFIQVDDKKDSNDIRIHHIPFGASQRRLKQNSNEIEVIANWVNNNFTEDIPVITYGEKSGLYQKFSKSLNTNNIAYYNNIKGRNDWADRNSMIQIGFNRQSDIVYLLTYIYLNKKDVIWNGMDNVKIVKEIEELLTIEEGLFSNREINEIMKSKILVDTEQNIMRIKCRRFSNEELCTIYLVNNHYYSGYIDDLAKGLNTELITSLPVEFEKYKSETRNPPKGKKQTNAQIFINWLDDVDKGRVIKTKEILLETKLTKDQLNEIRKSNKFVKQWFNNHKNENKKGYYIT